MIPLIKGAGGLPFLAPPSQPSSSQTIGLESLQGDEANECSCSSSRKNVIEPIVKSLKTYFSFTETDLVYR